MSDVRAEAFEKSVLDKTAERQRWWDERIILEKYSVYRLDESNWTVEEEVGERGKKSGTRTYHANMAQALMELYTRVVEDASRNSLETVILAVAEAHEKMVLLLEAHGVQA
jgi:hypothetical protein